MTALLFRVSLFRAPSALRAFRPLAAALVLAACGGNLPFGDNAPEKAPPPAEATETAKADIAPTAEVPKAPRRISPQLLHGLTPAEAVGAFGQPDLTRRDDTVQIMLFDHGQCVLELVFYEPEPGAHFRARRLTARDSRGRPYDTGRCIRQSLTGPLPERILETETDTASDDPAGTAPPATKEGPDDTGGS
ncbi:hypothetical protein [Yunchengibacter salinarum]|uniref:hypothetical protein n=1 Tax=Yunchengibacter salinarum TaxID=3133399 RepID=UPI0035B64686